MRGRCIAEYHYNRLLRVRLESFLISDALEENRVEAGAEGLSSTDIDQKARIFHLLNASFGRLIGTDDSSGIDATSMSED